MPKSTLQSVVVTDCGSTTTKAILIEKKGGGYRQTCRAECPTTVESPFEDITVGIKCVLGQLAQSSGMRILDDQGEILKPSGEGQGVDLYLSTCSAGGGLKLLVAGLARRISAQSARRAALGAGAIVLETLSLDDPRPLHEQLRHIRDVGPDIVLLVGGVEGGATHQVMEVAQRLAGSSLWGRFDESVPLPLIFAGNSLAAEAVVRILKGVFRCHVVENLRPTIDREDIEPVRNKIQEIFMTHVMTEAPGFRALETLVDGPVKPTPRAAGDMLLDLAVRERASILLADLGGATTDIFTVFDGEFERTVSANLGLSYSAAQVLAESGFAAIERWVPFALDESTLFNSVFGKTVRPTTIPDTFEELWIEQALAREALRLAGEYHFSQEWNLKGISSQTGLGSFLGLSQERKQRRMGEVERIIASGGALSGAPAKWQTAAILVDAFLPEGVTDLAVDSVFMFPHLGLLLSSAPELARDVFENDCLEHLGTCVAPHGKGRRGKPCLDYELYRKDGLPWQSGSLTLGELRCLPLPKGETVEAVLSPARGFDIGRGRGKPRNCQLQGGSVGLIFDARGRPLMRANSNTGRVAEMKRWLDSYQNRVRLKGGE